MFYLLPFRFMPHDDHEILVSEPGNYLVVPRGTTKLIAEKKIKKDSDLYKDLISGWFISEKPIPDLIDNLAVRLRTKKAFLADFTALHIFVLTLRCNQNCIYCQASSKKENEKKYDMSESDLHSAIKLMMKTPAPTITMEFQGGESTLVPELIKKSVILVEQLNSEANKNITYVICSNCRDVPQDLLAFCKEHNIFFSISLDGPDYLHNHNRGKNDSFEKTKLGIKIIQDYLGFDHISPLMTTSFESLKYPKEIIESYISFGFNHIFIRPLNPYGEARSLVDWKAYFLDFLRFYKESLLHIIDLNLSGVFFVEDYAAIILRKILTPYFDGFVDLQSPSGIINGVIVYNYDGYVYASDESRMLAETGDYTFQIGPISSDYKDLFYGEKAQKLSDIWCNECLAGCSDCAYQQYCGADPVRNYTTQHDPYGFRPDSSSCFVHREIIDFLFDLLIHRKKEVLPVFQSWIIRKEVNDD